MCISGRLPQNEGPFCRELNDQLASDLKRWSPIGKRYLPERERAMTVATRGGLASFGILHEASDGSAGDRDRLRDLLEQACDRRTT